MRDAALDLMARFGVNPGTRDFYATPTPQGLGYDIGAHESSGADTVAPTVSSAVFHFETRQEIVIAFSEGVAASVELADLLVTNLSTNQTLAPGAFTLNLNGGPTTVFWVASQLLADGNYRATLPAGSISDPAGNALASDYTFDFFVLAGDANRDRTVDITDLGILATNWQQSPRTFSQGNFNYSADGLVDISDLGILATNWQASLSAAASGDRSRPAPRAKRIADLTLS
jgi:hypothetical protein